jgi:hypothetical protein
MRPRRFGPSIRASIERQALGTAAGSGPSRIAPVTADQCPDKPPRTPTAQRLCKEGRPAPVQKGRLSSFRRPWRRVGEADRINSQHRASGRQPLTPMVSSSSLPCRVAPGSAPARGCHRPPARTPWVAGATIRYSRAPTRAQALISRSGPGVEVMSRGSAPHLGPRHTAHRQSRKGPMV